MTRQKAVATIQYLEKSTARKGEALAPPPVRDVPDSLAAWMVRYLTLAVVGVRSEAVARKITLQLQRFGSYHKKKPTATSGFRPV